MIHLRKIDRSNWREATFVTTDRIASVHLTRSG